MCRTFIAIAFFRKTSVRAALTDPSSTRWAVAVVAVVGIAAAVPSFGREWTRDVPSALAATGSGWLMWSALASWLGNWAFGAEFGKVSWWPMARAMAFAQTPGLVRATAIVEGVGTAAALVAFLWQGAAMAVVIREAYGFRDIRPSLAILAVALIPWLALQAGILLVLQAS